MAALRHESTQAVLLRTDTREFINRKQRGPVRGSETLTDWDEVRCTAPPHSSFPSTPSTLLLWNSSSHHRSHQHSFQTRLLSGNETWSGATNGAAKVWPFENPCVINIPSSPVYMHRVHADIITLSCIAGCVVFCSNKVAGMDIFWEKRVVVS